jgi:hypothetical protein
MSSSTYISTGLRNSLQVGMDTRTLNVDAVSIGDSCGKGAGDGSVCIGFEAGQDCSSGAICIGYQAGYECAGTNNIIIGNSAMSNTQNRRVSGAIVINATGIDNITPHTNGLFIKPIRQSQDTYYRAIDYVGQAPPSLQQLQTSQTSILGSFVVLPDSSGVAVNLQASIPIETVIESIGETFRTSAKLRITRNNGATVVYNTDICYNLTATTQNEFLNIWDISASLSPALFNTTALDTSANRTFVMTIQNTSEVDVDNNVVIDLFNGFNTPILQTTAHLNGQFKLRSQTLEPVYYDVFSGEVTYSNS